MHELRPPGGNSIRHPTSDVFKYHTNKTGDNSSIKPPMNQHKHRHVLHSGRLSPHSSRPMDTSKANTKRGSKQQTDGSSYSFFTLFALPLPLSVQSFVRVCFLFLVNWSGGSRIPLQVSETLLSPRRAHASCLLYTSPSPRD